MHLCRILAPKLEEGPGGHYSDRWKIKTEEKAKDVAAVRGTELIKFLAAIAKNRMNSSFSSNHPGAIYSISQIVLLDSAK